MTTLAPPPTPLAARGPGALSRLRAAVRRATAPRFVPVHPATVFTGEPVHCPAPTSRWFRCNRPLPCTSHSVVTVDDAARAYGVVLIESRRGRGERS